MRPETFGAVCCVNASMLTHDQFQALYEHGPEAVYELLTALYATRHAQQEQSAALSARVQELEARRRKDSHNSSKPLASDGLAKKPVSFAN